ncbi:hypothetical protein [Parapedobacter tibetensis]|uniref:hypothetical protein n=1 Tax=Parapedobacter tibetensis TaxID=2972951 RepID=UPI00214DA437|nr:hypothetical protein [Parapedobacter tibetensis]
MKTYLHAYLDELKLRVLGKSQIIQIVPADCYRLALEIKAETNKSVSETTVKRVFGFASSVHQPSIYTLNALAEYCGFESWDNFYTYLEQNKLQTTQQKTWGEISLNATKISLFNIQSNKHKCGIPYHQTIDRECMRGFVEYFQQSDATVGVLSGPAGYGKTVAVSRWVEKQISVNHATPNNDIYLFTNSLSLLQGTAFGYHSNRWLAHLLGFDTSELLDNFMANHRDNSPGNFYLVIDELHSDLVADRQFYTVINQFIEMVCHFAQYKWFRIVLVLRTITLLKYENLFRDTIINPQWFSVLSGETGNKWANMSAFSDAELYQLTRNINEKTKPYQLLKPKEKNLINIPLFFQYYHELYSENLNPGIISHFDEYLIVIRYLKRKIFNGINTMAKQAMMEELAGLIEQSNGTLYISKKQAYAIIKQYRTAYNDLLYTGVLHETGNGLEVRQQTVIGFQSDIIAAYFMALQLFNSQDDPEQLIQVLDQSAMDNKTKIDQLKWLLLFYIESGDLRLVNQFENIPFIREDRFGIIAFICDGLDKLSKSASPIIKHELNLKLHNGQFVEYMLNHTCFQAEYDLNLAKLLAFDLSDSHEITLRSKLAVIALLKWEEEALLHQLEKLSMIRPEAYSDFVTNPFKILSYLYQCFKGGTVDQATTHELNNFPHHLHLVNQLATNQLFDVLIYILVKVSGNTDIASKYSDIIRQRLGKTNPANTFELDFTSMVYALYLLECGDIETACAHAAHRSPNSKNNLTYHLLHTIFHIQLGKINGDDYGNLGQRAISICETHGFKLLGTYFRILTLEEMSREEQLQHISNLKFQFAAFGYTMGSLSKKYG